MMPFPRRLRRGLLFITLLWFLLVNHGLAWAVLYTDDLGRSIEIESPPRRIVSLAPGLTEILFSLGLDKRIVGVTQYCDYPPAALTKPKVGGLDANIEAILSLHPDLVVGSTGVYQEKNLAKFRQFGIPFFQFDSTSLEKIFGNTLVIGAMTGVGETAKLKVRQLQERLDVLRRRVISIPRPRVLYVVQEEPLISVGRGSFINDLIRDAGGDNITEELNNDYPVVSIEYVIKQDPQVIILATDADQNLPDQKKNYWNRWSTLSAVRSGQIYKVNRDHLNRPGPRVLDGLEELAGILHQVLTREDSH